MRGMWAGLGDRSVVTFLCTKLFEQVKLLLLLRVEMVEMSTRVLVTVDSLERARVGAGSTVHGWGLLRYRQEGGRLWRCP